MAKPIEATPPLFGEDAQRLLESLKECAPPDEIERRRARSLERLAQPHVIVRPSSMTPKTP